MEDFNEMYEAWVEILKKWGQEKLIELFLNAEDDEKDHLAEQVIELDSNFPGGLYEYWERAKVLLHNSKIGKNPFEGYVPTVPTGIKVVLDSDEFHEQEAIGVDQLKDTCFVLVAGGLGERLGYSSIKVGLPLTLLDKDLCYLKYYWDYIQAFEARAKKDMDEEQIKNFHIPLAIMTSGDTHERTVSLLDACKNFGMKKDQITIVKQELVPALLDNNATFSLTKDWLEIETKPHGHGDVHTLLHQHGVIQKWVQQKKKWVVFFQDTNALVFKAIPSALGVSTQRDFDVNTIWVPRKPGDAMGGIATLTNIEENIKITINVEYNQLEPLLKETWNRDGDVPDKSGYSHFPGNTNILIFKIATYLPALNQTKGIIPEFVNPKYKDSERDVFKSATRLECMMQDFPKLLPNSARVGFSWYDRWFSFSAVKNNIVDGAVKHRQGLAPETASSGEFDLFDANAKVLSMWGVLIEQTGDEDIRDFQGIKIKEGAKIYIYPSFGVTLRELQSKFTGTSKISKRSTLILKGERTEIKDLTLDSTLVTSEDGELVEGEYLERKYVEFKNIDPRVDDVEGMPEVIKIRGYKAVINDEIPGLSLLL